MANAYAYVQSGVVMEVEKRTIGDTEDYPIGKYYHGSLLPFFVEIRPSENAPVDKEVTRGWVYLDNTFHEPRPFEINQETGQMYLPPSISAELFWQTFQDNVSLRNELATTSSVVDAMLLEQLQKEGAVV